ncbi:glycine--tRNA ligase, partial [Verrucomicrobia bacterium]|nr:glycine--tRNA ligase [Verrucomicrobiota bacterium]
WEASGHTSTFSDPMCDCLLTKKRFRADQIDPLSGTVHFFKGATDEEGDKESKDDYAVLVATGGHPEKAIKTAKQFYKSRGLTKPSPILDRTEEVENSTGYNSENGGQLTEPREFNLMFKTYVGPVESEDNVAYLRPETAQAIFVQFKNVDSVSRKKLPFGICQTGKAFRNEINPRNFTFRSREFEQMELEFFIQPDEVIEAIHGRVASADGVNEESIPQPDWGWEAWHKYWFDSRIAWYKSIGLPGDKLHIRWQTTDELAHYARATVDIEFDFPFGCQELEGIAARGDYDLSQHQRASGKAQTVLDDDLRAALKELSDEKKQELSERYRRARLAYLSHTDLDERQAEHLAKKDAEGFLKGNYIPHVIEPSAGVDRLALALLCHAYEEEEITDDKGKTETRTVLHFSPKVAPYKVGVFPLMKNNPEIVAKAKEVKALLSPLMNVFYDQTGAIGRRYRRQDEIGTPFCVTIDFDSLGETPELNDTVTLRDRDTMKQERVAIADLPALLLKKINR